MRELAELVGYFALLFAASLGAAWLIASLRVGLRRAPDPEPGGGSEDPRARRHVQDPRAGGARSVLGLQRSADARLLRALARRREADGRMADDRRGDVLPNHGAGSGRADPQPDHRQAGGWEKG